MMTRSRSDLVIEHPKRVWIIELKVSLAKPAKGERRKTGKALAQTALAQIKDRGYHEPYLHQNKTVILMGIGIVDRWAYLDYETLM